MTSKPAPSSTNTAMSATKTPVGKEVADPLKPLLDLDGYLANYRNAIMVRVNQYQEWKAKIAESEGGMDAFTRSYERFGFQVTKDGIWYREWAPGAQQAFLTGEFSTLHPFAFLRKVGAFLRDLLLNGEN